MGKKTVSAENSTSRKSVQLMCFGPRECEVERERGGGGMVAVTTLDDTTSSTLAKVRYYAILRQTQLCQINGEALGLILADF